MTVDAGGLLSVTNLLESLLIPETITISGTGAGGHLELANFTVGGITGVSALM